MRFDTNKLRTAIDEWSMNMGEEDIHIKIPDNSGKKRNYLGMSMIGETCQRKAWYDYRKVGKAPPSPRMMRLFQRGHREEFFFVHMLRSVGLSIYDVDPKTGKQFAVQDFEGHLRGHMDTVARDRGLLYVSEDLPFMVEYKTYNRSRFVTLVKKGYRASDPKYYAQTQSYLNYDDRLHGALFCAVCKDDDELHFEWHEPDTNALAMVQVRAEVLLNESTPPPGISKRKTHWYCKSMCPYLSNCFDKKPSKKSCRSCLHASPAPKAQWECGKGREYGELCDEWEDCNA